MRFDDTDDGWLESAMESPPSQRQAKSSAEIIRSRNPFRFWRFKRDVKWIKKELVRAKRNPEDWRYLL